MKRTINLIIVSFVVFTATKTIGQCNETQKVFNTLKSWHVEPKENSTSFTNDVITTYAGNIKASTLIVLESDINELKGYSEILKNDISNGTCDFNEKAIKVYNSQITRLIGILDKIKANPIDFNVKEDFSLEETKEHCSSEEELLARWRKNLKILSYGDLIDSIGIGNDAVKNKSEYLKILEASSIRNLDFYYKSIKDLSENQDEVELRMRNALFNSIAAVFDPHSNYFTNQAKENFEAQLKTDFDIFGLSVEWVDDKFYISSLLPGGNAWKTNRLHVGDEILYLKVGNKKIKSSNLNLRQFSDILGSEEVRKVALGVKDKGGKKFNVTIYKETTKNEINVVQSYIISKNNKRIGYISLPSFYTDFNGDRSKGCANDVAKAILSLNRDKVEGIILDLRFNGGGSVQEFINLAGIFINYGPVGIVDDGSKLKTMKDRNKGTISNLPLVVMVNGLSASASEMFAASIQNHSRGIIVGEPTYGKATMQNIVPVGLDKPKEDTPADLGLNVSYTSFVKVTLGKIYKADKVSYQNQGIIPDVQLPVDYDNKIYGESRLPFALQSSSVEKELYFDLPPKKDYRSLQEKSTNRITTSDLHRKSKLHKNRIDSLNKLKIPLKFEDYFDYEKMIQKESEKEFEITKELQLDVENTSFEKEIIEIDKTFSELNNEVIDYLKNDIELNEVYQIAIDYINNLK